MNKPRNIKLGLDTNKSKTFLEKKSHQSHDLDQHADMDSNDPISPTYHSKRSPGNLKLFKNTDQRNNILQSYVDEHVKTTEQKANLSLFTQGKPTTLSSTPFPHPSKLRKRGTFGAPDLRHHIIQELHFEHCLLSLYKNDCLDSIDRKTLSTCNPLYGTLEDTINECKEIDFPHLENIGKIGVSKRRFLPNESKCLLHV